MPQRPLLTITVGGLLWFGTKEAFLLWVSVVILMIALYPTDILQGSILTALGKQLLVALTVAITSTVSAITTASAVGEQVNPDEALRLLFALLTLSIVFSAYCFVAANFHEAYRDAVRNDLIKHKPAILTVLAITLVLSLLPFLLISH